MRNLNTTSKWRKVHNCCLQLSYCFNLFKFSFLCLFLFFGLPLSVNSQSAVSALTRNYISNIHYNNGFTTHQFIKFNSQNNSKLNQDLVFKTLPCQIIKESEFLSSPLCIQEKNLTNTNGYSFLCNKSTTGQCKQKNTNKFLETLTNCSQKGKANKKPPYIKKFEYSNKISTYPNASNCALKASKTKRTSNLKNYSLTDLKTTNTTIDNYDLLENSDSYKNGQSIFYASINNNFNKTELLLIN